MSSQLWRQLLSRLERELPEQDLNLWIRPLQAAEHDGRLQLYAPNGFVLDSVQSHYLPRIRNLAGEISGGRAPRVELEIGSSVEDVRQPPAEERRANGHDRPAGGFRYADSHLNPRYTFDNFVQGKSNQLARAAAAQVGDNPGDAFNPLLMYGGTGLGKTHLLHAAGNLILANKKNARVVYLHSERFVSSMIKALRHNTIDDFKRRYRSVDALLIDDIQFFAGKERSQEEFFHTFNALLDGRQQIVLTCDRYPKEVNGLEDRLKSRFGWGLNVAIEPPDFETRVAILISKAQSAGAELNEEVAFFIAKRVRSNVRDLEGTLNTLCANARFMGQPITVDFARETLRDLLAVHERLITLENIQKTVAEYYKIRVSDLLSKRRSRMVARPRQLAMALAKELTEHSLPEIGEAFGGRDHTTVLHACRKINELCDTDLKLKEDRANLWRRLTT